MKKLRRLILLTSATFLLGGCGITDPAKPTEETSTLESITASNYTTYVEQNEVYTFDGKVTAHYTGDVTKDVTNYTVSNLDTSMIGDSSLIISYTEVDKTVSTFISISVIKKGEQNVPVTGVSLSETSKTIKVGEKFTLTETIFPSNATNKSVSWSSSKSSIAAVTNGVVTGMAKGTANITVRTADGNKTAICSVNVIEDTPDYDTITPEEAVSIISGLQLNVVSDKEYYVRGIASNVEKDQNGFNGGFLNSRLKFRSVKGGNVATSVDDIQGKEVIILGYLENYNDTYQIPYLPANVSPTGLKYNAQLISVSSEQEETVDVTNISVSPVSKNLVLGETATLSASIQPENASDKSITWSSNNSNVCSVNQSGLLTATGVGNAVITAKSSNNLTATCNVTVTQEGTSIEGDPYVVSFNHFESDGQTALNSSTIGDQIVSGKDYISSYGTITRVYKGMYGLKFGTSTNGGTITMNFSDTLKALSTNGILLDVVKYGNKSTTITVKGDGTEIGTGSSSDEKVTIKIDNPKELSNVTISSSGRFYLSKITFVCEAAIPVPVTAITIASTKAVSTGNTATLPVTYTPSNANTGKKITWTTNNASVATVLDGTVTGVSAGTAIITATTEGGLKSSCTVTVSDVAVTGVSLSSASETISLGSTKQLTATVVPSNATNKKVTWSSSNASAATVDQNGLVTAKAVGTTTITVTTADGNKKATCSISVTEMKKDKWTIMIYMCGADLESENGLATSDIKEILSVANQPDDVNIVIETGGSKSWSLSSSYFGGSTTKIDSSKLQRWHVSGKKLYLDESLSSYTSMGASSTLESYIKWGIEEYPAEKTGLIFWNHGGAMYGCCYDEKKNDDSLLNSEMKAAFSNAFSKTGTSKLEFVGYDTCLTQVQDIAEFNSQYFNYMIASEESESGYGWDYDTWIDDVYANKPTETILKSVVDGFISDNGGASSWSSDQTLSFLDLTQMAAYKSAFESFASALSSQLSKKSVKYSTFASWMSSNVKAFAVDGDDSEKYFCLFDVKDMINKLSSDSSYNPGDTYITNVNNAFAKLVKYSVAQKGAGNAYGLGCIYCQSSSYSSYLSSVYNSTETNFSNWLSFCKTYSYL